MTIMTPTSPLYVSRLSETTDDGKTATTEDLVVKVQEHHKC